VIRIEQAGDPEGRYRIDLVMAGPLYVTLYADTVDELMLAVEHHYSARHYLQPPRHCPLCIWRNQEVNYGL